jgi:hypothetical protein
MASGRSSRRWRSRRRAAKESDAMARFAGCSNMHASVAEIVGEPADGERASIAPCLAIDESTNFLMGQATGR